MEQRLAGRAVFQYSLVAYNFSSKEMMKNANKFHDITSELYWNMRSWFYNHAIALPNDVQLRDELIARRWTILPNGKIKVESKEDYKKRTGGKSPDKSDSLALSLAGGSRKPRSAQADNESERAPAMRKPYTAGLSGTRF
jgi:hypothetical protein